MAQQPQHQPQQQPDQQPAQPAQSESTAGRPSDSISLAVQRLWEVVRKGADVIVTLRQENAMLQTQMAQLRLNEVELQGRVDDFVQRMAALEGNAPMRPIDSDPHTSIDRLEDKVNALQLELNEAHARLAEQSDVSQQLMQLRLELETRTQLLQELQDSYPDRQGDMQYGQDAELMKQEDQLSMFAATAGGIELTANEVRAIADKLDSVAVQLDELARLS